MIEKLIVQDIIGRMTRSYDDHDAPVEERPLGAGPKWGHLPHGQLTNTIIGAGFHVHNVLGPGFLEAVYANALTVELRHLGVPVDRNVPYEVLYRGVSVGRYVADLVVNQVVIVETKAGKAIDPIHRAQLLNYLRASGVEVGLLVNFGSSVQFKRVVLSRHQTGHPSEVESDNGKT